MSIKFRSEIYARKKRKGRPMIYFCKRTVSVTKLCIFVKHHEVQCFQVCEVALSGDFRKMIENYKILS